MSEEEDAYIEFDDDDDDEEDSEDIIISDSDDDDEPIVINIDDKEIERRKMESFINKYNAQSASEIRILRDLMNLKKEDKNDLGFTAEPYHDMINVWEVRIFKFDKKDPIYKDMEQYKQRTGKDYIEMRVSFPPDYPESPPFVRVVAPRCVSHTGRITLGGSICAKVLTLSKEDGWNPIYDLTNLIRTLVAEMMDCEPKLRIDWNRQGPYSKEEAIDAYLRVANGHEWKLNDFRKWTPL